MGRFSFRSKKPSKNARLFITRGRRYKRDKGDKLSIALRRDKKKKPMSEAAYVAKLKAAFLRKIKPMVVASRKKKWLSGQSLQMNAYHALPMSARRSARNRFRGIR